MKPIAMRKVNREPHRDSMFLPSPFPKKPMTGYSLSWYSLYKKAWQSSGEGPRKRENDNLLFLKRKEGVGSKEGRVEGV